MSNEKWCSANRFAPDYCWYISAKYRNILMLVQITDDHFPFLRYEMSGRDPKRGKHVHIVLYNNYIRLYPMSYKLINYTVRIVKSILSRMYSFLLCIKYTYYTLHVQKHSKYLL